MLNRRVIGLASALVLTMLSGCVERRFVIETTPPGSKVYVNNRPVGFSPVDVPYTYYGKYAITLERDGYQTQLVEEKISAPWYAYPPIDFIAEHIYPFKVSDIRRLHYDLTPTVRPNIDELRYQAEELRERGRNLPEPTIQVEPARNRNQPPVQPLPQPQPQP